MSDRKPMPREVFCASLPRGNKFHFFFTLVRRGRTVGVEATTTWGEGSWANYGPTGWLTLEQVTGLRECLERVEQHLREREAK